MTENVKKEITLDQLAILLKQPFTENCIHWRLARSGFSGDKPWAVGLAYVDARAIMERLDSVVGAWNWSDTYRELEGGKGYICNLGINIKGVWRHKEDAANATQIESIKGGMSDAFKRAAVKWGVGRYLYGLEEAFVECSTSKKKDWKYVKDKKSGKTFYWKPPKLPSWALPEGGKVQLLNPSKAGKTDLPMDKNVIISLLKTKVLERTEKGKNLDKANRIKDLLGFKQFKEFEVMTIQKLSELNKVLDTIVL